MALRMSCRGAPSVAAPAKGFRSWGGVVAAPPAARPAAPLLAAFSAAPVEGRGRLVIRAARVGGVEIPNQKRLETALT